MHEDTLSQGVFYFLSDNHIYTLKAKKKYGQHFLKDDRITEEIATQIAEANINSLPLLEIGPGKGALTMRLIGKKQKVNCVELDQDMVDHLEKQNLNIQIIQSDVLDINPHEILEGKPFFLCGNYPYNISSQILFWMLSARDIIPLMVGMYQYEVAERILSKPGSRKYGILSVLCQAYYDCSFLLEVPPESFNPEPRVNSAVIKLTRNSTKTLDCDEKQFKRIVKMSFGQRRKKLSNSLKSLSEDRTIFEDSIFSKRPEHLSVQDFVTITQILNQN